MAKSDKKRDTGCPIAFALDTFGDRWTLLVIRDIVLRGRKTYGDFLGGDEGIATNVLADRLRQLEAENIIWKSRDLENHRKFNYSLTEKGRDLLPVLIEMIRWSYKYDTNTKVTEDVVKRIDHDRLGFANDILARLARD